MSTNQPTTNFLDLFTETVDELRFVPKDEELTVEERNKYLEEDMYNALVNIADRLQHYCKKYDIELLNEDNVDYKPLFDWKNWKKMD